jgi:multimeric flavodoxin WrbA
LNIIVLHGSPRKNGNSDTLVKFLVKGLEVNEEHIVEHFFINDMKIKACQGCLNCANSANHSCAIKDDMEQIYFAYKESDIIVFATPMYWGYMTAQLKTVIDRMEALAWEGFSNKIFVIIITYRHHFESTVSFFKRIAPFFNIDLHIITCCTYDKEFNKDLPIMECQDKLEEAYELGIKLNRLKMLK